VTGVVNPEAHLLGVEQCAGRGVPVIVDAAAQPDVRPYLRAGADLVIASGHKVLGAPTSGLIAGRKELVRACYLQNWGIGRAMKVGKEGIVGLMAALEAWEKRDPEPERRRLLELGECLEKRLAGTAGLRVERAGPAHRVDLKVDHGAAGLTAQALANVLREGSPPIWVRDALDAGSAGTAVIDLRRLSEDEVGVVAGRIAAALAAKKPPQENVPYHDLYRSRERLLRWPD